MDGQTTYEVLVMFFLFCAFESCSNVDNTDFIYINTIFNEWYTIMTRTGVVKNNIFTKMMAQSCSKSSFAFAFFIALRDNNNGISEGTTSVRIIFFFPPSYAGISY